MWFTGVDTWFLLFQATTNAVDVIIDIRLLPDQKKRSLVRANTRSVPRCPISSCSLRYTSRPYSTQSVDLYKMPVLFSTCSYQLSKYVFTSRSSCCQSSKIGFVLPLTYHNALIIVRSSRCAFAMPHHLNLTHVLSICQVTFIHFQNIWLICY